MTSLRVKLLLGLTPLVAILIGLGAWAVVALDHLGGRIDVILRENYASVLAAEGMKEALERIDSAALLFLNGQDEAAQQQFAANKALFDLNLDKELKNLTIPGEQQLADQLTASYHRYLEQTKAFHDLPRGRTSDRWDFYTTNLLPAFTEIKEEADGVLRLNQRNMEREDSQAREAAGRSKRVMISAVLGAVVAASVIALIFSRSILRPIQAVTESARGLAQGNYDQLVPVTTRDELGELATTFNRMARTLREYRQAGSARLVRAQQTTQATIDSFPDPVIVVDLGGFIERANPAARQIMGVDPAATAVPWVPPVQLREPLSDVLSGRANYLPSGSQQAIGIRQDGQERFFLPRVLAIQAEAGLLLGAAVVLQDVTKFRLVDQLKSDMVATVSHELKTPLTSVQMAVHLLLEEIIGPLVPKQIELLLAARQDADRLLVMVNDLLDLTRIEQGHALLDLKPAPASHLVHDAIERSEARANDLGITLTSQVSPSLPPVLVDAERVTHVFDNLIGNALNHTGHGGSIRVAAEAAGTAVAFSVADDGAGISTEHLSRIFDRFYRVPDGRSAGAGLGLAIAREVVTGHGGQIEARSDSGQGTVLTFWLPIATRPDGPPGPEAMKS